MSELKSFFLTLFSGMALMNERPKPPTRCRNEQRFDGRRQAKKIDTVAWLHCMTWHGMMQEQAQQDESNVPSERKPYILNATFPPPFQTKPAQAGDIWSLFPSSLEERRSKSLSATSYLPPSPEQFHSLSLFQIAHSPERRVRHHEADERYAVAFAIGGGNNLFFSERRGRG